MKIGEYHHQMPIAQKAFGQNFLMDRGVARKIVDAIPLQDDETIVEIGTGTGMLTMALAERFRRVITIEKDQRLVSWLNSCGILPENCMLVHADFLELSLEKLITKHSLNHLNIAGNLPYNVSTQILLKLCDAKDMTPFACLMFQKEVARRIVAAPGGKDYGVLSIITQYAFKPRIVMELPPALFRPKPKVFSSVIILERRIKGPTTTDYRLFKKVVKAAFSQRRKKLKNSLKILGIDRSIMESLLEDVHIDPEARAETVELEKFVRLANALSQLQN